MLTKAEQTVQKCCLDLLKCYYNQGHPVMFHETEIGFGFELHGKTVVSASVSRSTDHSHDVHRARKAIADVEGNIYMVVDELSVLRNFLQEAFKK